MKPHVFRKQLVCMIGLGLLLAGCDDAPNDSGQACTRNTDCEQMCIAICDPAPCTDESTSYVGECGAERVCSFELDQQGTLSPTVCP